HRVLPLPCSCRRSSTYPASRTSQGAPELVTLLGSGDGAAPSGGALCTCRRVETYGGGGGEVQALGLSVDGDPDDGVGEGAGLLGQPPGLVAEHPGGGPAHAALVELLVQVAVARP